MFRKRGRLLPTEATVLDALAAVASQGNGEMHPYGLAEQIKAATNAKGLTAHGSLYKALYRLEEAGLVASRWEEAATPSQRPRRRLYRITASGHTAVTEYYRTLAQVASAAVTI